MKNFRDIFYNETTKLSKKWENYFEVYDKHFSRYQDKNPTILEIGIAHGGSTEMLKKYFTNCEIYAVDYDTRFERSTEHIGVNVTLGDQSSQEFWEFYLRDKPNFDIIIDDGGHTMDQQTVTLFSTFPKLKIGGTYLVEDTHTSYWSQWGGGFQNPKSFIEISKTLVELLHMPHIHDKTPPPGLKDIFSDLHSITYYNSIVVFEKQRSLPSVEANNKGLE